LKKNALLVGKNDKLKFYLNVKWGKWEWFWTVRVLCSN